ncbi:MAG: type I methionyl aminopeptidase [Patescibacteria group bacterium]|jgi:methionyl aminopeptidase
MKFKSPEDIKNLIESGKRMGEILEQLAGICRIGISTLEVDKEAEKLIRKAGGNPVFKGYKTHVSDRPFPATICASLNHELVHGIPRKTTLLKDGDIFTIDVGMLWPNKKGGVITDTAITVAIGNIPERTQKLMAVTKEALERGIAAAKPGNSVASIGKAVESYVKSQGKYGVVRDLVGHGVGHAVHEDPFVPNYYDKKLESIKLEPGMVIAIEPMISLGDWRIETMKDGWTIKMADDSLSAHFEHTVVITETGNIVATRRPQELKY